MISGTPDMLREGARHYSGKEEVTYKNIEAGKNLSNITRTSYGPNGMNKMVINHLEKLFVTSDAATIMKELDIVHPAAKLIFMNSQMQEQEIGDGTNWVVIFAGELLNRAEALLESGLHTPDIISGYEKAYRATTEIFEQIVAHTVADLHNEQQVSHVLKTVISAKQYGYEDFLAPLISRACIQVLPRNPANFNVDNVRTAKVLGCGVSDTVVVKGFVLPRDSEGSIKHVTNAKVGVFAAGIDLGKTETKGTALVRSAKELLDLAPGEEKAMEDVVRAIAESGCKVVVSGSTISDLAMHYLERYKLMVVKTPSKFQLRRICKAVGATPLVKLGAPTAEELGHADIVTVEEIGSTRVVIFRQTGDDSQVSTLVVRGSTDNVMDDIERAIDDGVNVFKAMCKDSRFVAGGGASEIELARRLRAVAEATPGLDQTAMLRYAEAFEIIPRTLAENAGLNATQIISNLYAAHGKGDTNAYIDIETGQLNNNAAETGILDLLASKLNAVRLATLAAVNILRVDQIIMAKPAGGPKLPKQGPADGDDM